MLGGGGPPYTKQGATLQSIPGDPDVDTRIQRAHNNGSKTFGLVVFFHPSVCQLCSAMDLEPRTKVLTMSNGSLETESCYSMLGELVKCRAPLKGPAKD